MPATITRILINTALFGIAGLPMPGLCAPGDDNRQARGAATRIESTVIHPHGQQPCEAEDCGSVDRLTTEQLDRLRELDNKHPREFMEFSPKPQDARDRGSRRSR